MAMVNPDRTGLKMLPRERCLRRVIYAAAIMVLCAHFGGWAEENPWKQARLGDWCEYKTITKNQTGTRPETVTRRTVIAKDAHAVTLKVETKVGKNSLPTREAKIDLDRPYSPYGAKVKGTEITKLGEGKETVKAGGISYGCSWVMIRTTLQMKTGSSISERKIWSSTDAPLDGMVKMDASSVMKLGDREIKTESSMVLVASGRGK